MATATLDMTSTLPPTRSETPLAVDRIVLTGFMGSGKTTSGRLLADRLGWRFLDLDEEIERREGRSVPQIFAESGETHFRRLESAALATLLGRRRLVLALGGGATEELGNRLLLEQTPHTAVVYLSAPFEVLVNRCRTQKDAVERPVLADLELAAKRFEVRRRVYARIASHAVETSSLSEHETVDAVLEVLRG